MLRERCARGALERFDDPLPLGQVRGIEIELVTAREHHEE